VVAGGLIRRINALQTQLIGEDPSLAPAVSNSYYGLLEQGVSLERSAIFNELYLAYLNWNPVTSSLVEERLNLQSALLLLVNRNSGDYSWIIDWANAQNFPSVRLEDFWGGSQRIVNAPQIDPAFTLTGFEFVTQFMEEFSSANEGDDALAEIQVDFEQFYQREYQMAWESFAERFDEGVQRYRDRREWVRSLERMPGNDNPYFAFIDRMYDELTPFEGLQYASADHFGYFKELQEYTVEDASGGQGPGASKAIKKVLGKFGKVGKLAKKAIKIQKKTAGSAEETVNPLDTLLGQGVIAVDDYKAALSQVAFNADLRSQSLASLNDYFSAPDALESGSGPMANAWTSVYALQEIFGRPDSESALFWELYTGPLEVAYDFMMKEGSCELQDRWENDVLASLEGVEQNRLGSLIVGETGVLWGFLNGDAQSFVTRQLNRGYVPVEVKGRTMTLGDDFYSVLNNASNGGIIVGNQFDVSIRTLPSGTNAGASIAPYATFLNLHCSDGVQTLANYNYPSERTFNWALEQCGDTSLTIEIGQMRLTKNYPGVKGFARFLDDFRDGRFLFSASDFPSSEAQLRQANVSQIDINYQIVGQRPLIQSLSTVPLSLPPQIASCWPSQQPDAEPLMVVQEAPTSTATVSF
jgi:type VI secretion system protein ImpL